ncbi:MAG TPA: transcription antitermination factor NusB [Bacteroidia bacterium]|nr:transcription antitermination factor NusB [Bacteroidia bacterium]
MLNRRYLRIKAMQSVYSFFQSEDADMNLGEKDLLRSIDRTYDLYLTVLIFPCELADVAANKMEISRNKMLPTKEDLDPNLKFVNNRLIKKLKESNVLGREINARRIGWQTDQAIEIIRKTWENIRGWDAYKVYMASGESSWQEDVEFVMDIFRKHMADSDLFEQYIEEMSMHWPGDMNMAVAPAALKTFEGIPEEGDIKLAPLYKDPEDDRKFVIDLYRKTIIDNEASSKLIGDKTKNWEVDRIAVMDVILMKMAIAELTNFPSIPVKVTLNEYIEISKTYSTPKSRQFINGILDKLVADFREQGLINKSGRGLME